MSGPETAMERRKKDVSSLRYLLPIPAALTQLIEILRAVQGVLALQCVGGGGVNSSGQSFCLIPIAIWKKQLGLCASCLRCCPVLGMELSKGDRL